MADRIADIVEYVPPKRSTIATQLCGLVNATIPKGLTWSSVVVGTDPTSIVFANDETNNVGYVINLFTGEIFTNGAQPGGLPPMIRRHQRFVQLFGNHDFEVISSSPGVSKTLQPFHGCLYRFRVAGSELRVEEIEVDANSKPISTLKLCEAAWVATHLMSALPARLAALHSHWLWEEHQCVLVRPRLAKEKRAPFVIKLDEDDEGEDSARCYHVARDDQALPSQDIIKRVELEAYRKLVIPDEQLESVLSKFEEQRFIHYLATPASEIEIELPRYGMRFIENGGAFTSVEYSGYVLASQQLLTDRLWRFQRYLVLTRQGNDCSSPSRKVVVPVGDVVQTQDGGVDVVIPNDPAASISVNVFDSHDRFGTLAAETIESRLQLAALFTASASLLPWTDVKMNGGDAAVEVLRGCWTGRPLSRQAQRYLAAICKMGSRHSSTLPLMASMLLDNSKRLDFLYPDLTDAAAPSVELDASDELGDYCAVSGQPDSVSSRTMLTPAEESRIFGTPAIRHFSGLVKPVHLQALTDIAPVPIADDFVSENEARLKALLETVPSSKHVPSFPLTQPRALESKAELTRELKKSWSIHKRSPKEKLKRSMADLKFILVVTQSNVREKMGTLWTYMVDAVEKSRQSKKGQLLAIVNRVPQLTVADVLRIIVDDDALVHFTPQLTRESRSRFKLAARIYAELCVLDDKISRMLSRIDAKPAPPEEYFAEELRNTRQWSTKDYPFWLAFEVEGGLQIRREQYTIAKHLIENPGSITQLNMGRGKTRVILPMLFLYYRYNAPGRVVRAHFLSPLLSETCQFMHRVLSSGTLQLPFVELPFNRGVDLDVRRVRLMREVVDDLIERGGFLLIAPEHRLSLELKRIEISNSDDDDKDQEEEETSSEAICNELDVLLQPDQYIDIFDESDAVLHHKYHLVYAVGTPEVLDGGSDRWIAAEALLHVLMSPKSKHVVEVLKEFPEIFCIQNEYSDRLGAFNGFRLNAMDALDEGEVRDRKRRQLNKAILADLLENPPFELSWIKSLAAAHPEVKKMIYDPESSPIDEFKRLPSGVQDMKKYILALRGLLAYGVLESCLEKRNRVTYGLPNPGTRPKAVAIPFTAADLPSERSEFSHPDVSIVLTLLAYYHAGLTEREIRRSFETLLRLDYSEQLQYYAEWYQSVAPKLDERQREMLSKLDHISLDNAPQFTIVVDTFRYSTEVINFFLNKQVFPRDTKQYPHHLTRSAWDLVRGPSTVGFSGTNDTQRLLPCAVTQREPDEPALRGTNGKMIDLLVTTTIGYETLSDQSTSLAPTIKSQPLWRDLMRKALEKSCQALIDTGALLAGIAMDEAAHFLTQQPAFKAAGVTYYDTRPEFDGWVVLERERQLVRPLKMSSLHERDTFVIFDEARSRGSDMKLRADCIALLRLGPSITKDKLMQGAGRMRQLGHDQKLWITSTDEIREIKATHKHHTIIDILNWVIDNTEAQCTHGLLEWAKNGINFCAKEIDATKELHDDDWELESQYAESLDTEPIYDIVVEHCERVYELVDDRVDDASSTAITEVLGQIDMRSMHYGEDEYVVVSSFGEECERELQAEEEEEEEQQELGHSTVALCEVAWDPRSLFGKSSVLDVSIASIDVKSLGVGLKPWVYPSTIGSEINWDLTKVYTTSNFWATVSPPSFKMLTATNSMKWTAYFRMIDVLVVFKDTTMLALTDQEADALMTCIAKSSVKNWGFYVVHLQYAARAIAAYGSFASPYHVPLCLYESTEALRQLPLVPVIATIGCLLFNGDTQLMSGSQKTLVESTLSFYLLKRLRAREETLRAYIEARRFPQRWTRSFLHDLATRMDLEAYAKSTTKTLTST